MWLISAFSITQTKRAELPSSHDIGVYVHNEWCDMLKELREDIMVNKIIQRTENHYSPAPEAPGKVSTTADGLVSR